MDERRARLSASQGGTSKLAFGGDGSHPAGIERLEKSVDDSKIVVCDRLAFKLFDCVNTRIARTLPQLAAQAGDTFSATGGHHLDGTVATIADRTGDSQTHRGTLYEPPESDALYPAANHKALLVLIFTGHGGSGSGYENFTRSTMQYFPEVYAFEQSAAGSQSFFYNDLRVWSPECFLRFVTLLWTVTLTAGILVPSFMLALAVEWGLLRMIVRAMGQASAGRPIQHR
jgi:hypothetical protein